VIWKKVVNGFVVWLDRVYVWLEFGLMEERVRELVESCLLFG
jgi:hypothetical protein